MRKGGEEEEEEEEEKDDSCASGDLKTSLSYDVDKCFVLMHCTVRKLQVLRVASVSLLHVTVKGNYGR